MSKEKFTRGPWEVSGKTYEGDGTAGYGVSSVNYKSFIAFCSAWFDRGEPESHLEIDKANADLIAMAPEMYQALVEVKDFLEHMHEMPPEWTITESTVKHQLIDKLLAEARGDHEKT